MPAKGCDVSLADVVGHYDDLDDFYRQFWGEHVHHGLWASPDATPEEATCHLIDVVVERARIARDTKVCDVGSGYGATSRILAHELGAHVTALTISPAQYAYAQAIDPKSKNPTYLLRDWLENGLDANSFDTVIAIESSEHMPDLAAFFIQAYRVLRSGGRLVVCSHLAREIPRPWERQWLIGPICREGRMPSVETVTEMQRLAAAAGLTAESFDDCTSKVRKTWLICSRRVLMGLLCDPKVRHFLRHGGPNRIYGLTMFKKRLAYRVGAMRYGILTFVKP